ncbi:GyrI-like domain-containing protein [Bdellovibrio sp. HCB-110]|uniref:GyrI-like domain-containing protein n=1 Tax=Bdellovibrio sp. HCB-110 TaxID=3391182 RepID=UPI0039B5E8FF
MKLTEKAEIVNWPATHYVCVEKIGPFMETAQKAWEALHKGVAEISKSSKITGYMSLYKIEPQMIYCAGVVVDTKPKTLPEGFKYIKFEGGKYSRFTLTGSYANLPQACGMAFENFNKSGAQKRDDYYIENYVNDPRTTPEDQLITEILIPTK